MDGQKETFDSGYNLESNSSYLGFEKVEITKVDNSKPWKPGPYAFAMEMGKNMGKEGIATLEELKDKGFVSQADIDKTMAVKEEVFELNKSGDEESRNAFVEKFKEENPDNKVQFQVVRGAVIVSVVDAPKQDTTQLFSVFGPGEVGDKIMYTA